MKKAVVTGANGFVGSAVCEELIKQGIEVFAVVRKRSELKRAVLETDKVHLIRCDLSEYDLLPQMISDKGIDVFFHFAWEGNSGVLRGDEVVQLNNVQFACDAVKAAASLECRRFIFAASIMEYEINKLMNTELTPKVSAIYSSAKVAADYITRILCAEYGIDYIRAVISNIYGPGEFSPRLINQSIRKMIAGEHCAYSPGNQLYDFIYIDDAAKSFVALAERGIANRTYYIGSENPKPLKEFLIELRDLVNPDLPIGLGEIPFEGISLDYTEFDLEAVKKDTGFMPEISFADGVGRTITWIKENDSKCNRLK